MYSSFTVWQQPHLLFRAGQLYRTSSEPGILKQYADLVFTPAEFMAGFAAFDSNARRYKRAPPLIAALGYRNRATTVNPPFGLAYWYWGLTIAQ